MTAQVELTKEEADTLLAIGFVEIDDPVRGHIQVRVYFDENSPGLVKKHGRIKVIRAGTAATGGGK